MSIKLTKPFHLTGEFIIPNQDSGWRGSLSYNPNKGLFVELKNLPLDYRNNSIIPLMTGIIDGNPYSCTLVTIYPEKDTFSGNRDGFTRTNTFAVEAVLFGKRFTNESEVVFERVFFSYSNFREWLNKPTIFMPISIEDHIATIKKLPKIKGSLDDSFDFEIEIGNAGSYPKESFDISLKQYVSFGILSKDGKLLPLKSYLEMNKIIKYFSCFYRGDMLQKNLFFVVIKQRLENLLNCSNLLENLNKQKK